MNKNPNRGCQRPVNVCGAPPGRAGPRDRPEGNPPSRRSRTCRSVQVQVVEMTDEKLSQTLGQTLTVMI